MICLIKSSTDHRRQTDGHGKSIFSYTKGSRIVEKSREKDEIALKQSDIVENPKAKILLLFSLSFLLQRSSISTKKKIELAIQSLEIVKIFEEEQ